MSLDRVAPRLIGGDDTEAYDALRGSAAGYVEIKNNISASAPTVNEDSGDGYAVGSRWLNTATGYEYLCKDATVGAAVWLIAASPSGTWQPLDPGLTSIAALPTAADRFPYSTAADTWAEGTVTAAGRAILDDADSGAQRTTLGLGSAATTASTEYVKVDGSQALTADWDAGAFEVRAQTFESDVATGTAPLVVASTTKVANLNADLLDDQTGSYYLDAANFTGTNWTDLTDAGATTLHKHDHGGQDGLADDDHAQYVLLAGRAGGQTVNGGTASGEDLTLQSTAHATRGDIILSDPLVLTQNSYPGSPTDGQFLHDTAQDSFVSYANGLKGWLPRGIYSQIATVAVSNTTNETSLISTTGALGTVTLPANFFKIGKGLQITMGGTSAMASGQIKVLVYLGGTIIASTGFQTLAWAGGALPFVLSGEVKCITTGAAGTVNASFGIIRGAPGSTSGTTPLGTTGTTIDTTGALAVDIAVDFTTASVSNAMTSTWVTLTEVF